MEPTDAHPYTESTPGPSECPSTGNDTVIVDPQELLGRTFLMDTQEDSQRFRARIVECISDHESNVRHSDNHVKFRISINEDEYEEIITYNELLDFIEKNQENDTIVWNSNVSWVIKVLSYGMTRTTMVQGSMCWSNGRMGRLRLNLFRSLQLTTL
jgi:hypothetical protein